MNELSRKNNTNKKALPLWFMVLFSLALIFTLSSFGSYAYQRYTTKNQNFEKESESYIQRLGLLQQKDVIDINWLHTLNPLVKKVQGRLIWSSNKQQGVMEFVNLPKLDKSQQYRLWIYDLYSRNKRIAAIIDKQESFQQNDRVVMPFTPSSLIKSPFKFELTLEEEGKEAQPLLLAQP